jgi:uncharacterized membrane protein YkvA (DUF1232 family)
MKTPSQILKKWLHNFDPKDNFSRIIRYIHRAGTQLVYAFLLLYNAYRQPETPVWAKRIIIGALAYLLAPIDLIPDLSPLLGFTDDLGVLMMGLVSITGHINEQVKKDARSQLKHLCKNINEQELTALENKIRQ